MTTTPTPTVLEAAIAATDVNTSTGEIRAALEALGIDPGGSVARLREALRPIAREAVVEAMQDAWNDFVEDTGCYPDCFERRGNLLYADFAVGNFATFVADRLAAGRAGGAG